VFKQARHPLIDQEKVVPNDIQIGQDYQAIVITGPNTGGKTITLKTLGLLQIMGQAGLPILAEEESQMGIFTEIFALAVLMEQPSPVNARSLMVSPSTASSR